VYIFTTFSILLTAVSDIELAFKYLVTRLLLAICQLVLYCHCSSTKKF